MIPSRGGSGNSLHGMDRNLRPVLFIEIFLPILHAFYPTYLDVYQSRSKIESI